MKKVYPTNIEKQSGFLAVKEVIVLTTKELGTMKSKQNLFPILLLLCSLGQVTADLYLPALPAISHNFGVTINLIQWSVSAYMWGFAISQLVYGPLSDGIGRKKPLIAGLILVLTGSFICLVATSAAALICGRFIQGIGAGSGIVITRAIMRDRYSGSKLVKLFSYLSLAGVPIMAGAPLIGGTLQHGFGWRANFVFLTAYACITLATVLFILPETNKHQDKKHLHWQQIKSNLIILFKSPLFIALSLTIFMAYGGVLAWLTSAPVLLQVHLGLTPIQFGCAMLITGAAYAIGLIISGRLVSLYGIKRMLSIGLALMVFGAISMLILLSLIKTMNMSIIVIPTALFFTGCAFMFANAYAGAIGPFPEIAGIAGSIFAFTQIAGGGVASGILAHIDEQTQLPLAIVLTAAAAIALAAFLMVKNRLATGSNN